jgi:hypothetical protein
MPAAYSSVRSGGTGSFAAQGSIGVCHAIDDDWHERGKGTLQRIASTRTRRIQRTAGVWAERIEHRDAEYGYEPTASIG